MQQTRQIFLGDASLATGFRLAGFVVFPDADVAQLDELLHQLTTTRAHAFVVIDSSLADANSRQLDEVRHEGGRILLTQVPSLTRPETMNSSVDEHIRQLLGLEEDNT